MPLEGWNPENILYMVVEPNTVEEDLTNFPLCIRINTSSQDGYNSSFILDKISYTDRKKIAVTYGDGAQETECYVEIESWDDIARDVCLWAKIPTILKDDYTFIKFYYDRFHVENTTYIGDTGDSPAQQVWDTDNAGVWHFATNPPEDSTGNATTPTVYGTANVVQGFLGKALEFTTNFTYVDFGNVANLTNYITVELLLNVTTGSNILSKGTQYYIKDTSSIYAEFLNGSSSLERVSSYINIQNQGWKYLVWIYDNDSPGVNSFIKIDSDERSKYLSGPLVSSSDSLYLGASSNSILGKICDLRISNIRRSYYWLEAQRINFNDDMLKVMKYYVSGRTKLLEVPTPMQVSLYKRSTGKLVSTTTSDSNGIYVLPALDVTEHDVVGFENQYYNHVLVSKITPLLK